jgi:ribosomal protein S18 acetylase RimI-like enzyme
MSVTIHHGFAPAQRGVAVALYWQAFGGKLGRVLGPDEAALRFLDRVIRADHVLVATQDDTLVGLAGFKTAAGAFVAGTQDDLRAVYGRVGALWRGGLRWFLGREVENARFLMDGICVAQAARGHGIGSRLIDAICDEARQRGYSEVRLDVIDTNERARALYERLGFVAIAEARLGPLRHIFGFRSATTMVRRIAG